MPLITWTQYCCEATYRHGRASYEPRSATVYERSVVGLSERTGGTLSPTSMTMCSEISGYRLSTLGAQNRECHTRDGSLR